MEAILPAAGHRQPFRDSLGEGTIVFDPVRVQQADTELFDPGRYGADAELVSGQGGRGAAWYVRGPFGEAVLRHYRRGGLAARLGRRSYLWRGEPAVRSLREFRLLQALHADGLPVPAPIAAMYRRRGMGYEAAILVARVPGARSFLELVRTRQAQAPWEQIGAAIGRCHRLGAHHADLNANNILLDREGRPWLIDWDKGRIENAAGAWCATVLQRLQRSLLKECGVVAVAGVEAGMDRLRAAHQQALAA